mgnify:CR=1 FL=1
MNYNRADLANLYEQVQGKEVPDNKHLHIYGEGTSEDHKIADRNDVGYKDANGEWKFTRASNRFINDIMLPNLDFKESGSYMNAVATRARAAGIVDKNQSINSEKVKRIFKYVEDAAGNRNKISALINKMNSKDAQSAFINSLGLANKEKHNLFGLVNSKYGSNFKYDSEIMIMRPAGEDAKTRGAAGPGETLFAFLLNGAKPVVGDLDLNSRIIELKKNNGRIGKGIKYARLKELRGKFNSVQGKVGGSLKLNEKGNSLFSTEELKETLGSIIDYYSGSNETIGTEGIFNEPFGDWLKANNRSSTSLMSDSTVVTLVQYIAILHLRQYIKTVLGPQKTEFMVVFDDELNYSGFNLKEVETGNVHNIINTLRQKGLFFKSRDDSDGYQINLTSTTLNQLK